MDFYLSREGVIKGPYSEEELRQFQKGRILKENDLIWRKDWEDWRKVGEAGYRAPEIRDRETPRPSVTERIYSALGLRVLDRYIIGQQIKPFFFCVLGVFVFILSYDLVIHLKGFLGRGLSAESIANYYILQTPEIILSILPVCFFLSVLYSFTQLNKSFELAAMQSAGISKWRIMRPILVLAMILGFMEFGLGNYVVPKTGALLEGGEVVKKASELDEIEDPIVRPLYIMHAGTGATLSGREYNMNTHEIMQPCVEYKDDEDRIIRLLPNTKAANSRASWNKEGWTFENVYLQVQLSTDEFPVSLGAINSTNVNLPGLTADFVDSASWFQKLNEKKRRKSISLTFPEIVHHKKRMTQLAGNMDIGWYLNKLETDLHTRLASPCAYVVIGLITMSIILRQHTLNTLQTATKCLGCGACLFLLHQLGIALGTGDVIPPQVEAWGPNIAGVSCGIFLVTHRR